MPVETLTQNQKNYILMLLMGGELPENEIRMFLARSGWSIDSIDAGVLYSKNEGLKKTLAEAKGVAIDAPVVTTAQPNEKFSDIAPTALKSADPYRETAESVAQDFSKDALSMTQTAISTSASLDGIKQPFKNSTQPLTTGSNPLIMTMPEVPKEPIGKAILTTVAWVLFVLLILMIAAVLGYMYYTGTGIFGDVIYTRLNLNV